MNIRSIMAAAMVAAFSVILAGCDPDPEYEVRMAKARAEEIYNNNTHRDTGLIATVGGCKTYRVAITGQGPNYTFFTVCPYPSTVDTTVEITEGKTKTFYTNRMIDAMEK